MKTFGILRRLYDESGQKRQYWLQFLLVVLLGILNTASSIAIGFITQGVLELTLQNALVSFGIFLVVSLAASAIDWVRTVRLVSLKERIRSTYRVRTASALLGAELGGMQGMQSGDLISRANTDSSSAGATVQLFITGVKNLLIPLILLVALLVLDWRLALGFLLPLVIVYFYHRVAALGGAGIPRWRKSYAAMTAETQDLIGQRTTVKAYRLEQKAEEWMKEKTEDFRRTGVRGLGVMYLANMPSIFVNILPLVGCAGVGAVLAYQGILPVQSFVAAFMLAQIGVQELLNLPNIFVNMPTGIEAGRRLFEIWDLAPETSGNIKVPGEGPVLKLEDVVFNYPGAAEDDRPVLDGLSFTLRPGERVALVGPSGCGKSTVLKLAAGLYQPERGTVSLWGHDIREWTLADLRANISMMQQETFLFEGTIQDNIACASPAATKAQLAEAADKARLLDWIEAQPEKWDTPVGERGGLLSGGQRQRVGLARLFLQDAPFLLLDEATAALDTANEAEVLAALAGAGGGKAQLIVAHRLSAIVDADRILVLENGRVAEEGSHESLLAAGGLYASLYTEQAEGGEAQ